MAGDEKFYALHVNPAILETPVWRGSPEALHLVQPSAWVRCIACWLRTLLRLPCPSAEGWPDCHGVTSRASTCPGTTRDLGHGVGCK